jgi:hypothetical protein
MAGALDKCINLLSENGNMSDIAKSLDELSKKSMQYYADRYGMMGIPAHKYGRKRLNISDDLSKSVPAMYFMVENALSSISKFGSTEEFACKDKSFEDIINQSSDIANKYMLNEEERAAEHSLENAKNIAGFQAKVLTDKVKGISKTMFKNYRNDKNIDDYLTMKRNMSFSDKVKYYTLCRQLKLITEVDISAVQAENYFKNFDETYKKELDLKLKNPICKRILGSGKPTAFSDWDKYEKNADNLSIIYLSELDSIINENAGLGNAVNNAAAGKQGDELIDAACTKCAQIITLQILSKDKGRSLLYGMKLDSDYDNEVYKSLVKQTTEYFKAKRTFELKNDENLVTKADSVINNPKTISNVLSNIAANEKRKQLTDDNRINQVNKQPKQKGAKKK